jgi:hypothetical protein
MGPYRNITLSPFDSFLPDLDRIATRGYEPTDDDILRARLRTVGVQEYKVHMGSGSSRDWCFYDVGGARTVVRYHVFPCLSPGNDYILREMPGCPFSTL